MRFPSLPAVDPRALAAATILTALLGAAFWPTILWLGQTWWVDPYYTHGPLAVAAAGAFVWRARRSLSGGEPALYGILLIAFGLALRISTFARVDHVLESVGLLLVLAGLVAILAGSAGLRAVAVPFVILALAVPIPQAARVAPWLASHAAGLAAQAAGLIGLEVVRSGAQLVVADGAMTVGAPCSGLRSLVALLTLSVVLAGVLEGPRDRKALLVLAAVPVAFLANGLRLVALIWVAAVLGLERGMTFFHGPSSAALFLVSTAGLVVIGHALGCDFRLDDNFDSDLDGDLTENDELE